VAERCFGCGKDNPSGLHIEYVHEDDGSVSTTLALSWLHSGVPNIVHGGIQATILDEVFSRAAQLKITSITGERHIIVTATFELRYCVACPTDQPIRAVGRVQGVQWPSVLVEGDLRSADGRLLTEAKARWRVLDTKPPSAVTPPATS
jgi:acyl-coenzyme A thioesterase PaaI-like protein